jgi:flagellar protein FliS
MRGINQYKSVSLHSASNEQLVVMLYEAAVRYQILAVDAIEGGEKKEARENLRKVREIFSELMIALDVPSAPELAGNLTELYRWLIREISEVGMSLEAERLEKTLEVTTQLLEGWGDAFGRGG